MAQYVELSSLGSPAVDVLNFSNQKAQMELKNLSSDKNVTYKIKTTAPKLFVVKPIQGIITPSSTVTVEVQLQGTSLSSISDVCRHKFKVEATPTDL